jgi:uncharacterized membrane protein YgcG
MFHSNRTALRSNEAKRRCSTTSAIMDLNSENIDPASAGTAFVKPAPPVAPAKKVRKRRKSVGPAMSAASDALDASDAEREDSAPFASEADTAPGKSQTEPPLVTQSEPPPVTQPEPSSATDSDLPAPPATADLSVEALQIELHVARSEVKRLSFELETALQDNEDLQDQNSELRKQLAHMEASLAHEKEARAAAELRKQLAHMEASLAHEKEARAAVEDDAGNEIESKEARQAISAKVAHTAADEDLLQLLRNAEASLATIPPSKQASPPSELPPPSTTLSTCALSNPVAFSARLCGDMAAMTAMSCYAPQAPASLAQASGPAEALQSKKAPAEFAAPLAAFSCPCSPSQVLSSTAAAETIAATPVPQSTPRRPRMPLSVALPSTPGLALLSQSRPPTTLPRHRPPVGVPAPSAEVATEVAAANAEVEVVAMAASTAASTAAVATGDAAEATMAPPSPPPPPSPAAASVAALEETVAPPPPSPAAASAADAGMVQRAPSPPLAVPSKTVPPPIASPVGEGAAATRRRARRKSVVSRADLALHQEDVAAEVAAESAAEAAAAESASSVEAATVTEGATMAEVTEAEATAEPDAAAQTIEHVTKASTSESAVPPPNADALDASEASSIQAEAQAGVSAPLPMALPDESTLRSLSSPAEMLSAALEAAIGATQALGAPGALGLQPAQTEALRALFGALGQIASSQAESSAKQAAAATAAKKGRGGKVGGSAKNGSSSSGSSESSGGGGTRSARSVQFTTHDLSSLAPPGRAGSRPQAEAEQEAMVERLAALIHSQWALLPVSPNVQAVDAKAAPSAETAAMRACLATLQACLEALGSSSALSAELRAASSFYGVELWGWLRRGQPMLWRRLGELLSSSLRLHLSAIFSEEEDAEPDPLLATMRQRVREHVAAHGPEAYTTTGTEESFSSVITTNLLLMHRHAPTLAPGTAAGAALAAAAADDECAAALHELPAEMKDSLLAWAHAHSLLQQIFGPREPLGKLMKLPVNVPHFARLSALASVASALESRGSCDEAYLAPLRDIPQLQRDLHTKATWAKVAHETLLVFAKRRTTRAKRGEAADK